MHDCMQWWCTVEWKLPSLHRRVTQCRGRSVTVLVCSVAHVALSLLPLECEEQI